ncbi:DUF2249 domain-containing protein [Mumia sp. ZJ1417]|uniref:DUF2249 domain-containing protein n=1 Tax=unclassified Mumia TaxID=2621872 RepID=UPI0014208FF9|nr:MULTISPECIES: DUF2249 domain-containing protein [unclassified Mumia]QMW67684.1 DUF2249 domain-containing protein [Mumia sp. ZJ1417]
MSELVIASSEADAHAAEAIKQHHAALAGALSLRTEALLTAATRCDASAAEEARRDLVDWGRHELMPHALAEEQAMYPAAHATVEGHLLVEAMLGEHQVLSGLLREVADSDDLLRAAATATALRAVFDSHLTKENDLVVPLLAATPEVSLHDLLGGMHQLLGDAAETSSTDALDLDSGCGGHTCSCGEVDGPGYPELDVRPVPHAIRHATIFGALESVQPGNGLTLIAPHDPLPLLDQVNQRWPGIFSVAYTERGPEAWRLNLVRANA